MSILNDINTLIDKKKSLFKLNADIIIKQSEKSRYEVFLNQKTRYQYKNIMDTLRRHWMTLESNTISAAKSTLNLLKSDGIEYPEKQKLLFVNLLEINNQPAGLQEQVSKTNERDPKSINALKEYMEKDIFNMILNKLENPEIKKKIIGIIGEQTYNEGKETFLRKELIFQHEGEKGEVKIQDNKKLGLVKNFYEIKKICDEVNTIKSPYIDKKERLIELYKVYAQTYININAILIKDYESNYFSGTSENLPEYIDLLNDPDVEKDEDFLQDKIDEVNDLCNDLKPGTQTIKKINEIISDDVLKLIDDYEKQQGKPSEEKIYDYTIFIDKDGAIKCGNKFKPKQGQVTFKTFDDCRKSYNDINNLYIADPNIKSVVMEFWNGKSRPKIGGKDVDISIYADYYSKKLNKTKENEKDYDTAVRLITNYRNNYKYIIIERKDKTRTCIISVPKADQIAYDTFKQCSDAIRKKLIK